MINDPTGLWPPSEDDPLVRTLRGALTREADEVLPGRDGLRRIRAEIAARERAAAGARRRRWQTGLVSAAAGVLVIGGVATALSLPDKNKHAIAIGTASPTPSTGPTSSAQSSPTAGAPGLPVYYNGRTWQLDQLFREFHPITDGGSGSISQRVQAAITLAMSERPSDPDYQTLWPAGAAAKTTVEADLITIVLNRVAADGITLAEPLLNEGKVIEQKDVDAAALQQLIWTATAAAAPSGTTGPVRVRISTEGATPNRFGSINLAQPFRRGSQPGDNKDPRALVWIDSLGQDATVPIGRLTVHGQSTGATPPLHWTLELGGKTVGTGEITPTAPSGAELGVGLRGEWTTTLDLPESGRYRLSVTLGIDDGGGGTDTKDFVVQGQ